MLDSLLVALEPLFATAFSLWGSPVSWTEVLGSLLALWMVACNMRVNALGWPLAMLSSALYGALFLQYRLYGEAGLQLVFIAVAAWGWLQWRKGLQQASATEPLRVRRMSHRERLVALLGTLIAWPVLGRVLELSTNSDVPYFDALPTVASITGQLLLGRKLIENWPVWVLVNLVSMGLFAVKALWLTCALYAVFAILAIVGWRAWLRLEGQAHG
ncbi:nicotinamide riboside transporter PnuC [Ideonella sp.]|uniref:nicotinamide riboside transporter PnuC n=1 Tax=Ideonella sp. TaxID=1929293 RepID=UPI003BB5669D